MVAVAVVFIIAVIGAGAVVDFAAVFVVVVVVVGLAVVVSWAVVFVASLVVLGAAVVFDGYGVVLFVLPEAVPDQHGWISITFSSSLSNCSNIYTF